MKTFSTITFDETVGPESVQDLSCAFVQASYMPYHFSFNFKLFKKRNRNSTPHALFSHFLGYATSTLANAEDAQRADTVDRRSNRCCSSIELANSMNFLVM